MKPKTIHLRLDIRIFPDGRKASSGMPSDLHGSG